MPTPDGPPAAAGETPDRRLAGFRPADASEPDVGPDLTERRAAVAELGDPLRDLTSRAIGSEVDVDVLHGVAEEARGLAATLDALRLPWLPQTLSVTCVTNAGTVKVAMLPV